jgi:alpha-tubulin suppressor-like RCC1 family protein
VSAGQQLTASVKTDGTSWAWGSNSSGQLGQNNTIYRSSPVQVGALTNWAQISAGTSFVASVKTDGSLWTWGLNGNGQLGQNIAVTVSRSSPVQVGALTNWAQVSAGDRHASSVKTDGTLWSWGRNDLDGRLGDNTIVSRSSPVQVGALTNWSQVSAGSDFTAAVKTDGTLWAWGANGNGQLGQGNAINRSSPVQVGALTNWSQVSAGNAVAGAVKTDKTLWTWGNGADGSLGQNNTISRSSPVQVGVLTNWTQVSIYGHTLAILQGTTN